MTVTSRGSPTGPSRFRGLARAALLAAVALAGSAHVGSDTVFFEGMAGPHSIRVVIRPPQVIPGLADISVRVKGGGADRVTVQPFRWDVGEGGAPPPDPAEPVTGDEELYSAQLWLMTFGSYSVHVTVEGPDGSGTAVVPLNARRSVVLAMPRWFGVMLLGLAAFLFVGAVTIVGAAVREGVVSSGEVPSPRRRRRALIMMAGSVVVFGLALYGGKAWWDAEDRAAQSGIYAAFSVDAEARLEEAGRVLAFTIVDDAWRAGEWTPLVPDHGKLMHMFLVRDDFGAFAHVHPVPIDTTVFELRIPEDLPAGNYRIYADIVHESGFTQTLVDTTDIMASVPGQDVVLGDPDDSWLAGSVPVSEGEVNESNVTLDDGAVMTWDRPAEIRVGSEMTLTFRVSDPDGSPAHLEPYMGMLSHAAVSRDDGTVFVHLHPSGSVSMGALRTFTMRTEADSVIGTLGRRMMEEVTVGGAMPLEGASEVHFPFEFPRDGRYRIWVQVKRDGRVLTAAFDAEVTE